MKGKTFAPKGISPSWQLVRPSVQLVWRHIDQVIFLFLLPALVMVLGSIIAGNLQHAHIRHLTSQQLLGIKIVAAGGVWSLINMAPSMYFRVHASRNSQLKLSNSYKYGFRFFWRLLGLYVLFALVVIGGLILFVLPGFVALFLILHRYYLAGYYLVDRDLGIRQTLSLCSQETGPYRPYIWGVIGVQLAFGIVGSLFAQIFLGIGSAGSQLIGLICLFLPALRYFEIAHATKR